MSKSLNLGAMVGFGMLFGIAGVLFAVPLMVVAMTMLQELYVKRVVEAKSPPSE